jgi:DnaJ-class molecular chaperone
MEEVAQMEKKFAPEKYAMMACPVCNGQGWIFSPDDVKVCQNCGGFGFVRKESKTYIALKTDPILTQRL